MKWLNESNELLYCIHRLMKCEGANSIEISGSEVYLISMF